MSWSHLSLHDSATYTYSTDLVLSATGIMMRYDSRIAAESIDVTASDFHLEGDAYLDVAGRGPAAGQGQSRGGGRGRKGGRLLTTIPAIQFQFNNLL